jgi:hypothetical protein
LKTLVGHLFLKIPKVHNQISPSYNNFPAKFCLEFILLGS